MSSTPSHYSGDEGRDYRSRTPHDFANMFEDELLEHIIELKETGSPFNQRQAYDAFNIWERYNSTRSAHTIYHAAHSLLLSGFNTQKADSLALRMRMYEDHTRTMDCDWHADVALAYVREKQFTEAHDHWAISNSHLDYEDMNRRLRNNVVYGRIMLGQRLPYAKVIFWKVVQEFKRLDREGFPIDRIYFRNALWFAMLTAGRWQQKELQDSDKNNVFAQLYGEVMNGVELHDGTTVKEDRHSRRLAAKAMRWSTPLGRPFVGWFISRQ